MDSQSYDVSLEVYVMLSFLVLANKLQTDFAKQARFASERNYISDSLIFCNELQGPVVLND